MRHPVLRLSLALILLPLLSTCGPRTSAPIPAAQTPPPIPREFRAAWVAAVNNIDWPSKPGLSTAEQQDEILTIVDTAASLNLNALIVHVRPSCDALYPSQLEPWSQYLTGQQGRPPEPLYDPLQFWIDACHRRGIELHAWINPFRARHESSKLPESPDHASKRNPQAVVQYGNYLWMDPAHPDARAQTLAVVRDLMTRYDLDGLHIDDYFYPYPIRDKDNKVVDFPDDATWSKYQQAGGKLSRGDWRRANINDVVRDMHATIHAVRPRARFGISPFGIWKPGHPEGVQGFNQYEQIYADARLWLNEGWCDYFTPQLYWKVSAPQQPYEKLLQWWQGENTKGRHLWPGNYTSRVADGRANSNWPVDELTQQIDLTRKNVTAGPGNVHFSMKALLQNRGGLADTLRAGQYASPALVPQCPWLPQSDATPPKVKLHKTPNRLELTIAATSPTFRYVIQARYGTDWKTFAVPGNAANFLFPPHPSNAAPDAVYVSAVSRTGAQSKPVPATRPR